METGSGHFDHNRYAESSQSLESKKTLIRKETQNPHPPGEGTVDAGLALSETRLYRRRENGDLQEYLGQNARHYQNQRTADARCDLGKIRSSMRFAADSTVMSPVPPIFVVQRPAVMADSTG